MDILLLSIYIVNLCPWLFLLFCNRYCVLWAFSRFVCFNFRHLIYFTGLNLTLFGSSSRGRSILSYFGTGLHHFTRWLGPWERRLQCRHAVLISVLRMEHDWASFFKKAGFSRLFLLDLVLLRVLRSLLVDVFDDLIRSWSGRLSLDFDFPRHEPGWISRISTRWIHMLFVIL